MDRRDFIVIGGGSISFGAFSAVSIFDVEVDIDINRGESEGTENIQNNPKNSKTEKQNEQISNGQTQEQDAPTEEYTLESHTASETQAPEPDTTTISKEYFPFEFESDTQGFQAGERRANKGSDGTASWSSEYDGSIRMDVSGSPGIVQIWRTIGAVDSGTEIIAEYAPENYAYNSSSIFLRAVPPSRNVITLDIDDDGHNAETAEQDGVLRGEIPRDLPKGTEIEIDLRIWPGSTNVWIKSIRAD
ncbi:MULTISPECIES: hypothetical protein [Haloarcula]|uniref:hypothetical protein n=1 Tax=Haloarcula TaxID=2237 RepID=UPI000F8C319E|nr:MULTISPECIES: hypothetical protein [Haloarcula]NHX41335.1 hypothetical protein [Haloarcula sp. R1-2]